MVEKTEGPEILIGKREVPRQLLVEKSREEWRPGEGPGREEPGEGLGPEEGEAGPTLTEGQLSANRKLVKGIYIALVAGGRVLWKLPDSFTALPEEVEALQDAWETLIPPDYILPKALIITATIMGEKVAQAVALRKEAKGKALPGEDKVPPVV